MPGPRGPAKEAAMPDPVSDPVPDPSAQRLHLLCPHCGATNRVPRTRLADHGKCGACHVALMTGQPLEIDAAGLRRLTEIEELPLLVDCWAPWCGPCRAMAPQFERAAADLEPEVRLAKLNTEDNQEIASRLGISAIPTFLLLNRGREIGRLAGARSAGELAAWTRNQLIQAGISAATR
jgi:thioredoxin 2